MFSFCFQRKHLNSRSFHCDLCDKSFWQADHLKHHRMIHTGEKPYSCNVCGNSFRWTGDLGHHRRTQHGQTHPYSCPTCKEIYATTSELNAHEMTMHPKKSKPPPPLQQNLQKSNISSVKDTLPSVSNMLHKQHQSQPQDLIQNNSIISNNPHFPLNFSRNFPGVYPLNSMVLKEPYNSLLANNFSNNPSAELMSQKESIGCGNDIHTPLLDKDSFNPKSSQESTFPTFMSYEKIKIAPSMQNQTLQTPFNENDDYENKSDNESESDNANKINNVDKRDNENISDHENNSDGSNKSEYENKSDNENDNSEIESSFDERESRQVNQVDGDYEEDTTDIEHYELPVEFDREEKTKSKKLTKKKTKTEKIKGLEEGDSEKETSLEGKRKKARKRQRENRYCAECDKTFATAPNYKRHMANFAGHNASVVFDKPFACEICGATFREKKTLTDHRRIHTGERPYSCEICSKTFRTNAHLHRHKPFHTQDKKFVCDVCGHKFFFRDQLTRHARIHKGEFPFPCELCDKAFREKSRLEKHKILHINPYTGVSDFKVSGYKPFVCDVCDKAYPSKQSLVRHKKIHTENNPNVCEYCNRPFHSNSDLRRHKMTHTGDVRRLRRPKLPGKDRVARVFHCPECDMAFDCASTLKIHKAMHIEGAQN